MRRSPSRRNFLQQVSGLGVAIAFGIGQTRSLRAQPADTALDDLARMLAQSGEAVVLKPGSAGHAKIKYYNARFDCVRSTTYLRPASADGVRTIVDWANQNRRTLAVRGGGHSFEGKSSHPDLVIDMSQLNAQHFDGTETLRVEPGVLLGDVYKELGAAGHVLPAGTCPTVGIVGHTLGGGIGDFLPMFGYAAQSLTAAELVTFGGTWLRVDDRDITLLGGAPMPAGAPNPKVLMTALRGGGQGMFGVVTGMTFKTHDVRTWKLASFSLKGADGLSASRATQIIKAWFDWRTALPEPIHELVSAKMNLSRSGGGFEIEVMGLIAIPAASANTAAGIRQSLDPLFRMPEFGQKEFTANLDVPRAIKTFLDDDETTHNTKRHMLYGSSSALQAALTSSAIQHLLQNMSSRIFASLYTAGGNTKSGPATALHPAEFIVEWTTYGPRRDADAHRRIKALKSAVVQISGQKDQSFPNYPSDGASNYFVDAAQISALRQMFDPAGISSSSLLADRPAQIPGNSCGS